MSNKKDKPTLTVKEAITKLTESKNLLNELDPKDPYIIGVVSAAESLIDDLEQDNPDTSVTLTDFEHGRVSGVGLCIYAVSYSRKQYLIATNPVARLREVLLNLGKEQ